MSVQPTSSAAPGASGHVPRRTGWGRAVGFLGRMAARREARAIVATGLLTATFTALVYLIRSPELRHVDVAVTQTLQRPRSPALDLAARAWTYAGSGGTYGAVFAPVFVVLVRKRRWWAIGLLAVAAVLGHPLNWWIKSFINRPRPAEGDLVEVILPAVGTSFPSGHAQSAVLFYGFLAFLAWVHLRSPRARVGTVASLTAVILLISASRVYVGAHWFSDVVGGWTVGLFALFVLAETYHLVGKGELVPRHLPPHPPRTGTSQIE